jgi:hypothetical protein
MGAAAWALTDVLGPPICQDGAHITLGRGVRFENASCVWLYDWDPTNRVNSRLLSP